MAGSMYSVTVTGRVRGGRDAPSVWQRVARLLKLDETSFRERVLARVPVTLKAVDYEAARRQQEALTSAGADALLLAEDAAPRVWIRDAQRTCGPLSMAYVRHALREKSLSATLPACLQGAKQWQDLWALAGAHPAPAAPTTAHKPSPTGTATGQRQRGPSGAASAALVILASLALLLALGVLVLRPLYRSARMRTAVQQGMARTTPVRTAVAAYRSAHGRYPDHAAQAGLDAASGAYAGDRVTVDRGMVLLRFGTRAPAGLRGRHVRFMPAWSNGKVVWTCHSRDLPRDVLPASCR